MQLERAIDANLTSGARLDRAHQKPAPMIRVHQCRSRDEHEDSRDQDRQCPERPFQYLALDR